ncbi:MAG: hypothetical protein H6981_10765 [Gammaproteobacteria bacterium]|nr:hypothetical protein [Gammaproteobacteria bacterium]MCP5137270.1 hypothetical protein [Gammaproteobacteria bacterium]
MAIRRRGTDWARDMGRMFDVTADSLHRDPADYDFNDRPPHWKEHFPPVPQNKCVPDWVGQPRASKARIHTKWSESLVEPIPGWSPQDAYDDLNKWFVSHVADWLATHKPTRGRFPDEPQTNIDGLPIPDWLDHDKILDRLRLHYYVQHDALTAAHKNTDHKSRTPEHLIGTAPKTAISANYFVVHDTADTQERTDADVVHKGIHLWISPITLAHDRDWSASAVGTKIENQTNNLHFIHVEMSRHVTAANVANAAANNYPNPGISTERAANTLFTKQQYEDLAHAYIVNCLRRGRFLTVTVHKEVDRNIANGHNDPEHFDMAYFYRLINKKLMMPSDTTYGIEPVRAAGNNLAGQENMFIDYVKGDVACVDQYGAHGNKPGGGNYTVPIQDAAGNNVVPAGGDGNWVRGYVPPPPPPSP